MHNVQEAQDPRDLNIGKLEADYKYSLLNE